MRRDLLGTDQDLDGRSQADPGVCEGCMGRGQDGLVGRADVQPEDSRRVDCLEAAAL